MFKNKDVALVVLNVKSTTPPQLHNFFTIEDCMITVS
jgi:hypothetical protein